MKNIFSFIPGDPETEIFEDIVRGQNTRIERIVSKGHTSPATGWYDQDENEWVIVLQGAARLEFSDGREVSLHVGDHLDIPAHTRHRVSWTDPETATVWLAVFYT